MTARGVTNMRNKSDAAVVQANRGDAGSKKTMIPLYQGVGRREMLLGLGGALMAPHQIHKAITNERLILDRSQ